jgi:hypothetical protein
VVGGEEAFAETLHGTNEVAGVDHAEDEKVEVGGRLRVEEGSEHLLQPRKQLDVGLGDDLYLECGVDVADFPEMGGGVFGTVAS